MARTQPSTAVAAADGKASRRSSKSLSSTSSPLPTRRSKELDEQSRRDKGKEAVGKSSKGDSAELILSNPSRINSNGLAWARLISMNNENMHRQICSDIFTVGHSQECDLHLYSADDTVLPETALDTILCELKKMKHGEVSVVVLKKVGESAIQVNWKSIERNSSVILNGGDEVCFLSRRNSFILQLLSEKRSAVPCLLSADNHGIIEVDNIEVTFDSFPYYLSLKAWLMTPLAFFAAIQKNPWNIYYFCALMLFLFGKTYNLC